MNAAKFIITVVVTALLAGGGVYYWQRPVEPVNAPVEDISDTEYVEETEVIDLVDLAAGSDNDFVYLISAESLNSDWKMVLKNSFIGTFTLDYKFSPWGAMRYIAIDLSAHDGNPGPHGLSGKVAYHFCAGQYYCSLSEKDGMGFTLTFWDAKYTGRSDDPEFYAKNGDILLMETDENIVTYKPFKDSSNNQEVSGRVEDLLTTFELHEDA
jgi:hypothetical protein